MSLTWIPACAGMTLCVKEQEGLDPVVKPRDDDWRWWIPASAGMTVGVQGER